MFRIAPVLFLLLMACNTPGPGFRGLEPQRVTVNGATFDVRVRDDLAEALRVNMQWAPNLGSVARAAEAAMEQVSGCNVTELRGDQALVLGLLDCEGGTGARRREGQVLSDYDCTPVDQWSNAGLGVETTAYECSAQVLNGRGLPTD